MAKLRRIWGSNPHLPTKLLILKVKTMNLKEKTVVIDNKTYRYSKIVMLPTDKKANTGELFKRLDCNKLSKSAIEENFHNSQHLYFLSTDKICEGDWIYSNHKNIDFPEEIFQLIGENWTSYKEFEIISNVRKIIASTDPSLNLPKPSDSFLQAYIDAYNKSEKIEECLVEYIEGDNCQKYDGTWEEWGDSLKVTKEEITIRKVKESWSREEVVKLCQKCWLKQTNADNMLEEFNNWISENL